MKRFHLMCGLAMCLLAGTARADGVPGAATLRSNAAGLSVADVELSADWYVETLGFRVMKRTNVSNRGISLVFLERDGFMLELIQNESAVPVASLAPSADTDLRRQRHLVHGVFKIGLTVDDVDAFARHLDALGVPLKGEVMDDEPFGVRMLLIQDPDGNTVQFFEELRRPHPPEARAGHAMAWDAARQHLLVFGGVHAAGPRVSILGDTWTWNGAWTRQPAEGPEARSWPAAAWDGQRGRVVLFGGRVGRTHSFQDTWEHDGERWHRAAATGPSARSYHAMAWDGQRGRVVLFGGYHGGDHFGDTWEWDGERWELRAETGPAARAFHAMVYDGERVLLLGGGIDDERLRDVWAWDGESWREVGELPRPRALPGAAAWDPVRRRLVVFGGWQEGFRAEADTWEWDGEAWEEKAAEGPSPRGGHVLAFDAERAEVVLFGGGGGTQNDFENSADLWTWDGTWTLLDGR